MEAINTYLDFAEDDYRYFTVSYNHGYVFNGMAVIGQNICEKYLKHIVDKYIEPESEEGLARKAAVLRTHNLRALVNYLQENGVGIDHDIRSSILKANGFCYSARYPGEDSFFVTREDLDEVHEAVETCREAVMQFVTDIENGLSEPEDRDVRTDDDERIL